jgi:antitoxin HicB
VVVDSDGVDQSFRAHTQGDSEEEALEMAADALRTMIQEHIRKGEQIPRPSKPRGRKYRVIRMAALDAAKAELYSAFRASGIKKVELARRLGIPKTTERPRGGVD